MTIRPVTKEEWVSALRGDNFKQGRGQLASSDGYCCIGVLGVLMGISSKQLKGVASNSCTAVPINSDERQAVSKVEHALGLHEVRPEGDLTNGGFLAEWNDRGWNFPQIADWIEANL